MDDENRRIAQIKATIAARAERSWRGEAPSRLMVAGHSGGGCAAAIIVVVAMVGSVLYFRAGGQLPLWLTNAPPTSAADKNASFPTLAVGDEDWGYGSELAPSGSTASRTACIESAISGSLEGGPKQGRGKLCVRSGEDPAGRARDRVLVRFETPGPDSCAPRCVLDVRFDDGAAQSFSATVLADDARDTLDLEDAERFIAGARSAKAIRMELDGEAEAGGPAKRNAGVALAFEGAAPLVWN